jgi:uncharacterized protein YcbK (DUF882 family)
MGWRYFDRDDFICHDETEVPDNLLENLDELVGHVLDPLRDAWRGPLWVVSGYRTEEYNRRIKGAEDSMHVQAKAADIRPGDVRMTRQLHDLALRMRGEGRLPFLGGIGLYRTWIHVDTGMRADGRLRRWTGKGVGSENPK